MAELSREQFEVLQAKSAAFDAIQATKDMAQKLNSTNELLKRQVRFAEEVSEFLHEVAGDHEEAQRLIDSYKLEPPQLSENQEA